MEFLKLLPSLTPLIAPLLVFAACCYYLTRRSGMDAIFMTVGAGIVLVMAVLFTYMPYYVQAHALSMTSMLPYLAVAGGISLLGTFCFTTGLVLLIDKVIKLTAKDKTEKSYY